MTEHDAQVVEDSLAKPDIHDEWEGRYREDDIRAFQEEAVDRLVQLTGAAPGSRFLDAGCGTGYNAIRLANHGYDVVAGDFSEEVLSRARENVAEAGVADRVELRQENLLELSLPDESADHVVCWGVLMHIPDVDRAIDELVRVLRPGGTLTICEGNVRALDEVALRVLDRLGRTESRQRVPAGMERWRPTPAGPLFARRTDVRWLTRTLEQRGLVLRHRLACLLTEAYIYVPPGSLPRRAIQALNRFWFRHVRTAHLASDVFLIFEKPSTTS
jgi:SAM-dependent methyltransferase